MCSRIASGTTRAGAKASDLGHRLGAGRRSEHAQHARRGGNSHADGNNPAEYAERVEGNAEPSSVRLPPPDPSDHSVTRCGQRSEVMTGVAM
jgi:hypothetical protein